MFFFGKYYHFQWKLSNLCLELWVVQSSGCLTKSNDIVSANLSRLPCYVSTLRLPCYVSTAISQLCQFEHNGAEHFDQFSQTEDWAHQRTITCRCVQLTVQTLPIWLNSYSSIWSWGLLSLRIKELNDIHGMLDNSQRGSKAWIENGRNVSSHRQCFKIGQHSKYRKEMCRVIQIF